MTFRNARRRILSNLMTTFCAGSVLIALVPLAMILFFVVAKGAGSLSWAFFTELPKSVGETGGGMSNAIAGSLIMCGLGALFAIPVGVISGIYIVESRSRFAPLVRFAADALNGVPSIVVGLFIYVIVVVPLKQFNALAGGLALGVMMIPLITRTTEELLRLVPASLREGALALGATRSRAVFSVVLPAALPGIVTGIVLALARIAGETAPLLFTALGSPYRSTDLTQPMSSMTVQIYRYALSPYEDLHQQAWAGAFVLVSIVLICSILARLATARLSRMRVAD
jgi:phosphate transport system permease protein